MFLAVILAIWLFLWALLCLFAVTYSIYNLCFHPYSRYPGPFFARICPFYSLWHAYYGDLHIDVLRCHEKYGVLLMTAVARV
jgi:hypothetical protein